jgi:aldehyde dehydrogenase (NAD+)
MVLGSFTLADGPAVHQCIADAHAAAPAWMRDAAARAHALHGWANALERRSDALIRLVTREVGKPVRESRAELARAIGIVRYYAQAAYDPIAESYPTAGDGELLVHRRPHGVVSVLCPWNFPIAIPAWKIAPALAFGNTVLFRPSSEALATAHLLVETARESLPEGVLGLIVSDHRASAALVDDPRIRAVSFTGSVPVGTMIIRRAAERGIPVQAEMGGQNASIVLPDADLPFAAETVARASMEYAGQKCTATRRAIVLRQVADEFARLLADSVDALAVGDPDDESTAVGPLINEAARTAFDDTVAAACARGAVSLTHRDAAAGDGWFVAPTVLRVEDPTDTFVNEETFGPAVAVLVVDSEEDAVRLANATRFGLSAAVFTRDLTRGRQLAAQLDVGLQRVNAPTTGVDFHVPFGGEKASGYGPREQGRAARDFFTHTRTMLIHPSR